MSTTNIQNIPGKYEDLFTDEGEIGAGSFGIVYKVKSKVTGEFFAVKRIEINDEMKTQMREIEILSILSLDYSVRCLDIWSEEKAIDKRSDPYFYIQMELCSQNLETLIKTINNSFDERLKTIQYFIRSQLFLELIECLNYLHSSTPPILHRDLKPENVLVTDGREGRFLRLCDFGLSKILETSHNTRNIGTSFYMAPEVKDYEYYNTERDKNRYNLKSDIYSLGVIATKLFNFGVNDMKIVRNKEVIDQCVEYYARTGLEHKFRNLFEIISIMLSKKAGDRPDCEELLRGSTEWTIDTKTVTSDENYTLLDSILADPDQEIIKNILDVHLNLNQDNIRN